MLNKVRENLFSCGVTLVSERKIQFISLWCNDVVRKESLFHCGVTMWSERKIYFTVELRWSEEGKFISLQHISPTYGYNVTTVPWYNVTMVQHYNSTMIQWYNSTMVQRYNGKMIKRYISTTIQW